MSLHNQTVALAGLWQALDLVHQYASKGVLDAPQRKRFDASIASIFQRIENKDDNAALVFGGYSALEYAFHGFALALEQVGRHKQVMSYMLAVLALQKRLAGNASLTQTIASSLGDLERQHTFFGKENEQLVSNLANLYGNTLGNLPMRQRIRIYGRGEYLQQPHIQNSIRALLLAGIRAAMLWHQVGGNRFLLLLQRKRLLQECRKAF